MIYRQVIYNFRCADERLLAEKHLNTGQFQFFVAISSIVSSQWVHLPQNTSSLW